MILSRIQIATLVLAVAGVACHGRFAEPRDPCDGIECSGHGRCLDDEDMAICVCDDEYIADGLECVEQGADGDSDADVDADEGVDSDVDADSPFDVDVDSDDSGFRDGACANADDRTAIERADYGESGEQSFEDVAAVCGQMCALDPDPSTCNHACIQEETDSAASDECAECFGDQTMCALTNCLASCMMAPSGDDCVSCRCGENPASVSCIGDFELCSGVPPSTLCE